MFFLEAMDTRVVFGLDYSSDEGEIENVPVVPKEIMECEGVPQKL